MRYHASFDCLLVTLFTMARPPFVDPDYWALLGGQVPTPAPPATDLNAIRNSTNAATQAASNALPYPAGMIDTVSTATSVDGTKFNITRFVPLSVQQGGENAQRAVIYAFGGGLIAGSVNISRNMIASFAEQTASQVFAPDYRLAPEHPYPAALDDVYSTITWLQARSSEFNIDPARVVIFGQSAGGNLVAAAALKGRDEGLDPPLAAQILRYPMLDDRTRMDPQNPRFPYLTWSPSSNKIAWNAYLGKTNGAGDKATVPYYAAPGRAQDLHGLPTTHLGVGGLDLFRDEATSFAARLSSQDVKVQSNVYPGVPHGFDGNPAFSLRTELWDNEARFIRQF
ncbi:Alpha/Beta hydrolase protein [Truncatella angustata]|uniref:Alpha/Beta hydrolase protein n=1 Tax=Truncatella angustata TaxID=152316 RepID=A0A9P8RQG5_9PEZI|nr:Alpha/Beta hydrolase protein [Truncatella angustata]KAH6647942.1 Alpha/Beta hydrolase protein [Truncatella angustata]